MSQFIKDFRVKNPAYDDMPDDQLVSALHNKYYSDIPLEQFNQTIGFSQQQAPITSQEATLHQPVQQSPVVQQSAPLTVQSQPVDGFTGATIKAPEEKSMLELISEKTTNILSGAGERAGDLGGSLLSTIKTVGEGLEEKAPLGGFVWEDGDILPSYKSPDEWAKTEAKPILEKGANALNTIDLGYQEQSNWQGVKDAFSKGGPLSGSAYAEVLEYGLEQGVKSIPDMVATVFAMPAYIVARSGEIGEQRAINKGKEKADIEDVLEAAPFAAASALLERIGAKGMTSDAKADLGKELLEAGIKEQTKRVAKAGGKALTKEAATEAMQEGMIEYTGERFGTDAKMDFKEALDRAAAGAVAGGVMGGVVGTGSGIANEITYSPEKTLAKAMNEELDSKELSTQGEAERLLNPDRAQVGRIDPPALEASKLWENLTDTEKSKFKAVIDDVEQVGSDPGTLTNEGTIQKPLETISDDMTDNKATDKKTEIKPTTEQEQPKEKNTKPVEGQKTSNKIKKDDLPSAVSDGISRIKQKGDLEILKSNLEKIDVNEPVKFANAISSIANAYDVNSIGDKTKVRDIGRELDIDLAVEAVKQLGIKETDSLVKMQLDRINKKEASNSEKVKELLKIAARQYPDKDYKISIREFGLNDKIKKATGNSQAKDWLQEVGGVKGMKSVFNKERSDLEKYSADEIKQTKITSDTPPAKLNSMAVTEVKQKPKQIDKLKSLDKPELLEVTKTPNRNQDKEQIAQNAVEQEIYSNVAKSSAITTFNNSESFDQQVISETKKQTDLDVKKAADSVVQLPELDSTGKVTYPKPKADVNTTLYRKLDNKIVDPPKEGERVFNAPGHNYIGLFRSTGIPERRKFVYIEGRKLDIPEKPQRIESIMDKLVKIMGRRIYFGKIKGKSSEGFYRPGIGEIRTRKKNDVEVLAHEMAHYLDFYSNDTLPNFQKLYKESKFKEEVAGLSYTNADAEIELIEGFAEFVRLWLTNSTEAQIRAPKFYDAFTKLLAKDRKLLNPMRDMQDLMHKFYFQGPDKLGQALIGKDLSYKQRFNEWAYRRDSRIRQQTIDRFHAARKVEQELTGKVGNVQESAWKQFRIANGGAEGITDYILNYGTLNFDEKGDLQNTGKSLNEVFQPVKTIKLLGKDKGEQKIDLLLRYFAGRRALELHRQGRENLIPKETAKEWARLGKDYPIFESIQKEYQAFNDRMMDFYQEAGMITPEGRKAMQVMNKDYIPFNRIRDQLAGGRTGAGGGFQKLKGGTANLNDMMVNIQDGVSANVTAALNNRAKQRLYKYISSHKDGAIFATKIGPDSKPVKVYSDEMASKINKILEINGIQVDGELDLDSKDLLTFWQHGVKPTLNESGNIVDSVIIDGKPKYYEVKDPLLQDMLIAMNPESYSSFMNVMFGVKNLFTRSITLGVEFMGANLVRDTVGATFLSKNNFKPFLSSFSGMHSFITKDKYYQDFMRSGGGYSSRIEALTKESTARRRVSLDEFGVMTIPEKLISTLDNVASAFEYGTRIGEFKLAKKNNKSDMDAGFDAREISTDFSVLGANRFLTGYIRTVPFLNAMIQSQDRVYREALVSKKYDGNPAGMAMKAFLGITVPTLALWLINKDDEDYKNIPDHEKRTNWHFKLEDGTYAKVPRPYDVGFVYATMPELFFKYLEDDKGKEFSEGMAWTLTQMYGIDGIPAMMTGWWDLVRNKKWTGAPVIPKSLENVEATEQYSANTSETFVRLGEALGISPIKAEHAFKAYTGYLGGYTVALTDKMMWDKERFGEPVERKLSENIFLRRFITPEERPYTAPMEKFFSLKEKADKITATFKGQTDAMRAITGRADKDKLFKGDKFFGLSSEEKKTLFALNDSMNDLIKIIYGKEGIKTAEKVIRYNKNLTGKQKRDRIDELWRQRSELFNKYYQSADRALQKAKQKAENINQEK